MTANLETYEDLLARLGSLQGYELVRSGTSSDRMLVGLDSNENHFGDAELIRRISEDAARCDLRSYPREEMVELREMLARWLGVESDSILLGNGGDQLIDIVARILPKNGSAVTTLPTYSLYKFRVESVGARLLQIPLHSDFSLDDSRLLSAAEDSGALVIFLCSPNNPTGNQFSAERVGDVVASFPGLVVLDEAYVEFAERSLVRMTRDYRNLAVIRTFSKAFGVAGARLGYMVANPQLCRNLEKLLVPYSVGKFAARVGIGCLSNIQAMQRSVSKLRKERDWMIEKLRETELIRVFESDANFVLVCTGRDSDRFCARLRSLGLSVRNIGDVMDFKGCVRITVGTRSMNEKLLAALEEVMSYEDL